MQLLLIHFSPFTSQCPPHMLVYLSQQPIVFQPQCETPSFTPTWNNGQNYSSVSVYCHLHIVVYQTGRQTFLDQIVAGLSLICPLVSSCMQFWFVRVSKLFHVYTLVILSSLLYVVRNITGHHDTACVCVCVNIYMCVCVYIYIYMCVCIHIYIYIYVHSVRSFQ
jgi:hypothetical protein